MSDYFNLNDGIKKVERNFSKPNLKLNKRIIISLAILLAVPLTVGLALTQQRFFKFASGAEIASVEIDPGALNVKVGDKVRMSSLAYDSNHNPMFGGVNYQWTLSSSDTVATLDKTDKDISQLTALKSGCGELTVTGISNGNTITKALRVVVYDGISAPICAHNSLFWDTQDVSLHADEFNVTINGKKFKSDYGTLQLNSDPYYNTENSNKTTLEAIWQENGVEMRLFIYFEINKTVFPRTWKVTEVRTYDGSVTNPEWIYYKGFDGTIVGNHLYAQNLTLNSDPDNPNNHSQGSIYFEYLKLNPFLRYVYPSQTPMPTIAPTDIPSPTPFRSAPLPPIVSAGITISDYTPVVVVNPGQSIKLMTLTSTATGVNQFCFYGPPTSVIQGINLNPSSGGMVNGDVRDIMLTISNTIKPGIYKGFPKLNCTEPRIILPEITVYVGTDIPQPTNMPSPTPTDSPVPTPTPILGDYNGSGAVDIGDFNLWKDEFLGNSATVKSDVNNDGKIDLIDYINWRNSYQL